MWRLKCTALLFLVALVLLLGVGGGVWYRNFYVYQNGKYIPRDLDDAHACLLTSLPNEALDRIRAAPSEDSMRQDHMGLGAAVRNGWGLWRGSRLATHLKGLGFHHPDDMSGVVLATFWCRLHGRPFRLEARARHAREHWEKMRALRKAASAPTAHSHS